MILVDITVEIFYDGAWHDISADVLNRDGGIRITRGRRDEGSAVDPGRMTLKLRGGRSEVNPAVVGRYSPQNPRSDLFGKIKRYTPIRVRVPSARAGLLLRNTRDGQPERNLTSQDEFSRAYAAALSSPPSPVGDIDLRVDVTPASWNPQYADVLFSQWSNTDGVAWMLTLQGFTDNGFLTFRWFDGSGVQLHSSTILPLDIDPRKTVRVTMDVDNGAGEREVKFWLGDSVDGPFTQLGTTHTGPVTAIQAAAADIETGSGDGGRGVFANTNPLRGTIHRAQLREGIDGAILVDPDFESQEPSIAPNLFGSVEFTDSISVVWTLRNHARLTNPGIRARMEVASWPLRWDVSGNDVWIPAEAVGIMHRLANREEISQSTLRRHIPADPEVVGYWPCEEGRNANRFAAATPRTQGLAILGIEDLGGGVKRVGDIDLASYDGFPGSRPLPVLDAQGRTSKGLLPTHAIGEASFGGLFSIPATGLADDADLITLNAVESSFTRVRVEYRTGGSLEVELRDDDGNLVDTTGALEFNLDGTQFNLAVSFAQDGADITWVIWVANVPANATGRDSVATPSAGGVFSGQTFGRFERVGIGVGGGSTDGLAFGHIVIRTADIPVLPRDFIDALIAFAGEPAANRFLRLSDEQAVPGYVAGEPGAAPTSGLSPSALDAQFTERMGPQPTGRLLDILQECADADHAILYEARDEAALAFLPRMANYRVGPDIVLDYTAAHLSEPFHPDDDERFLTNEVIVSRPGGSFARAEQTAGPQSTQEPPDGIGRGHEIAPTLNLAADHRLDDHASWLLGEGVQPGPRYPMVSLDLRRLEETLGLPELREAALQLETGFRIDVTNLPEWLPPDDARLVTQGYVEQIERTSHRITFATSQYDLTAGVGYRLATTDTPGPADPVRRDTAGSQLAATFTAGTDTSMDVETIQGPLWAVSGASNLHLPLDVYVAGARVRVTAIGAAVGAVQTFTVEATVVNGVEKTIAAGEPVRLWQPAVRGL